MLRFFKWFYHPDIEPDKRLKPEVMENIPQIRRKELSIYKPIDLWNEEEEEEDALFLKYCKSPRDRCWHMISRGEVGLIVAGVGVSSGVLTNDIYTAVIIMIASTTIITPIWLKTAYRNSPQEPNNTANAITNS